MGLSEKALLVNMKISQWTGRKLDHKATDTVETTHSTQRNVGNYTKKLLPDAKELQEISRLTGAMRVFFYENTLPWETEGARILSSKNYMDFTAEFRKRKAEFDNAVNVFLDRYDDLREAARIKLGDLFNETEYPTKSYLINAFKCEITFLPLPDVQDFRVEILESEKEAFLQRMATIETNAVKDCWYRLHDAVAKAAVKLNQPEAVFRNSLIDNISDVCSLLPKLNITDNADLESMRQSVEKTVSTLSPDTLRTSNHARQDAAKQLDDITAKMSAFMGK